MNYFFVNNTLEDPFNIKGVYFYEKMIVQIPWDNIWRDVNESNLPQNSTKGLKLMQKDIPGFAWNVIGLIEVCLNGIAKPIRLT